MECFDKYSIKAFPPFCYTRSAHLQRPLFCFIHFLFILGKQLQDFYKDQCEILTKYDILSKSYKFRESRNVFSEFVFPHTLGRVSQIVESSCGKMFHIPCPAHLSSPLELDSLYKSLSAIASEHFYIRLLLK